MGGDHRSSPRVGPADGSTGTGARGGPVDGPGGATGSGWRWEHVTGPVEALVAGDVPIATPRLVRVVAADGPAFVLGSTQPEPRSPTPYRTVRRRSGGGGVLLVPGELLWVDIVIPRGDPWWDDDVGRAAHPVGVAWAGALAELGLDGEVHRGPLIATEWSRSLCFAGLGPGEVRVHGRKVVGISQRRTRHGACFQCAVPRSAPGARSVEAAGIRGAAGDEATTALAGEAGAVDRAPVDLLRALGDALDR